MNRTCSHTSVVIKSQRSLSRVHTWLKNKVTPVVSSARVLGKAMQTILKIVWRHRKLLGFYVFIYKFLKCASTKSLGKKYPLKFLISGAISGNIAFSKETSISSQITLYLLSRIFTGSLQYEKLPSIQCERNHFAVMTTICWALVMFLFEKEQSVLQKSLKQLMVYLYDDPDSWNSWVDFVPLGDTLKQITNIFTTIYYRISII